MPPKGKGATYVNGEDNPGSADKVDLRDFVKTVLNDAKVLQSHLEKFPLYTAAFDTERKYLEELRVVKEDRDKLRAELKTAQRAVIDLGAECRAYREEVDQEYREKSKGLTKLQSEVEKATAELEKMQAEKQKAPARLQERFEEGKKEQKRVDEAEMKSLASQNASLRNRVSELDGEVKEGERKLKAEKIARATDVKEAGFIKIGLEEERGMLEKQLVLLRSFSEHLGDNDKTELEQQQDRMEELVNYYFAEPPPKASSPGGVAPAPGPPFDKIYQSGTATEAHLRRAAVRDVINRAIRNNIHQHPALKLARAPPQSLEAAVQALGPDKEPTFRLLTVEVLEQLERANGPEQEHLNSAVDGIIRSVQPHMGDPRDCHLLASYLNEEFVEAEGLWMKMQKTELGVITDLQDPESREHHGESLFNPPKDRPPTDSDKIIEFCISPAFLVPNNPNKTKQPEGAPPPAAFTRFVSGTALRRGSPSFLTNLQEKKTFDDLMEQLAQKSQIASPALDTGEFGDAAGRRDSVSGVTGVRPLRRTGAKRPLSMSGGYPG